MENEIEVYRGDDYTTTITFTDDGAAINITGYAIIFTVRERGSLYDLTDVTNDSTALISKVITTHTNPTSGQSAIVLTPSDTELDPDVYVYDIEYRDTSGKKYTIDRGKFIVKADVTRRSAIS